MGHGDCDLDHVLRLSTDFPRLVGTIHTKPMESVKGISVEALEAFLIGQGVTTKSIDRDALKELIEIVTSAPLEEHEHDVARGTQAVNGDSVTYTLFPEIQSQIDEVESRLEAIKSGSVTADSILESPEDPELSQDGAINYYDQMAFVVVERGTKIATRSEKSLGFDGEDIFGQTIPANEGKSNESVLDDSITVNAKGICTASVSGVLHASSTKIRVDKELHVRSDVDFNTGRITFPGAVLIDGAVRDRFSVVAQGNVHIHGLVESASIESEENITLERGMAGKDVGRLHSKGSLDAGYLEAVHANIQGSVRVRGEITNSMLSVRGQLIAERAAIRGGSVQISSGARVGSIGSIQGVETTVEIGSLPDVEIRIQSTDVFLERLEREIHAAKTKQERFNSAVVKPTPAQIEEQMAMQFEIDMMGIREQKLIVAKKRLRQIMTEHTKVKIEVLKAIYPKSVIYLPGYRVEFPVELVGESIIELGPTGHPSITYRGTTTALSDHAKVTTDDRIYRVLQDSEEMCMVA